MSERQAATPRKGDDIVFFIDEADLVPHACANCKRLGLVPRDLLWTWDVPAQPVCRDVCPA